MEAYIDLSFIVYIINFSLSFIYSMIIFDNIKYKIHFIIQTLLIGLIFMIINLYFIPYFLIMAFILYSLFLGMFNLKLLKVCISTIIIYYLNNAFLLLVGGCFLYEGILLISIPFVSLFVLIIPIYITITHLIINIIYKRFKNNKFKVKCKIKLFNNTYKGLGYLDSGNALIYNDIPVIFVKDVAKFNEGEVIKIKGINDYEYTYLAFKGVLTIKNNSKNVYVVFVKKSMDFYSCDFLLNKYLM